MARSLASKKRRLILDAARRLLVKRGFQDIVLDDVARAAGVAKGTLFLHFRDKDELISAAFADFVDQLGEQLDKVIASGKSGKSLLEEAVKTILIFFEHNQDFMSQFGAGRFPGCGERSCGMLVQKMAANMRRMTQILKASSRGIGVEFSDLEYAAATLFGLCRSAFIYRLMTGDSKPLVSRTSRIIQMFIYGVKGKR